MSLPLSLALFCLIAQVLHRLHDLKYQLDLLSSAHSSKQTHQRETFETFYNVSPHEVNDIRRVGHDGPCGGFHAGARREFKASR